MVKKFQLDKRLNGEGGSERAIKIGEINKLKFLILIFKVGSDQ